MGIRATPSQFSILLSLPTETEIMQLSVSLPDPSSFVVFNPQEQLHPQVQVFQGCFVELGRSAGRRRKTKSSSTGRKIAGHAGLHY